MTTRLQAIENPKPIGKWTLPKTPGFLYADRFRVLRKDIESYVGGEISGRSYLIAGHRGSGKTSLVSRIVQDIRQASLEASPQEESLTQNLQRPLLVRLYGPSLLSALTPTPAEVEALNAAYSTKATDGKPGTNAHEEPKIDELAAKAGATDQVAALTPANDPNLKVTQAALVQITIALYRALAAEFADAYGFHAQEREGHRAAEMLELAAKLALELDTATSPGVLRDYWSRLGRLGLGVLWPLSADHKVERLTPPGQGLREIVAISTAAQAFEVCSGAVTAKLTNVKSGSLDSTVEAKGSSDLREMVGRLGMLGAGALTGAALLSTSATGAVVVGCLVWLIGSATLSWSFTRKRQTSETSDYTFLRDRSVQTLDRDLPVVIRRIREAGLSPVFVIDELDKIDGPIETVGDIIKRLKHIIADNGFFCFLTDRNYYDYVEDKLESQAYPKEHTYFSERRLLAYSPKEMKEYIDQQLVLSDATTVADTTARTTYILWLTHRARTNFASLIRDFSRLAAINPSGDVTGSLATLAATNGIRLAATIQLAIDVVLAEPDLRARTQQDASFAQLAHDGLYHLSRCWESGEDVYDARKVTLKAYLESRLKETTDGAERLSPTARDLQLIVEANSRLIEHLLDLGKFSKLLENNSDPEIASAWVIVPLDLTSSLLKPNRRAAAEFEFTVDSFGRKLGPDQGRIDQRELDNLLAIAREVGGLLGALKLDINYLTAAGLLPPTLNSIAIQDAEAALADWSPTPFPDQPAAAALATLSSLRKALQQHGEKAGCGLRLAGYLIAGDGSASLRDSLRVLSRYLPLGPIGSKAWTLAKFAAENPGYPDLSGAPLTSDPTELGVWAKAFAIPKHRASAMPPRELWGLWQDRLLRYFGSSKGARVVSKITFGELAASYQGRFPATLMARNLFQISAYEWSRLAIHCLRAAPVSQGDDPPFWALIAAMRALGFDRAFLERMIMSSEAQIPDIDDQARAFLDGAKDAPIGLAIVLDDHTDAPPLIPSDRRPALYIPRSDLSEIGVGLSWLQSLNAFAGVLLENDPS